MCIICVRPKDTKMSKSVLKQCFSQNPHGSGFAYPYQNKVVIEKGFFNFKSLWIRFKLIQDMNLPMIIHARIATSGIISKSTCHPFRIDTQHVMAHNGIIQGRLGLQDDELSDTMLFNNFILKPTFLQNSKLWKQPGFKWMIEKSIGKNNKMVILDSQGDYVIFNESEGEWDKGVWFSNDTYKNERKSIHVLGSTRLESRNGEIVQVSKKGNVTTTKTIKSPIVVNNDVNNRKIMKFVEKQTGMIMSESKELDLILKEEGLTLQALY